MNRKNSSRPRVGTTTFLLSDKLNLLRADLKPVDDKSEILKPDEKEILYLTSLASSGHNTQPWFVKYLEPLSTDYLQR
jgi:hypothetical protein